MKKTIFGIMIALLLGFTGCSESDIQEAIDKARGEDNKATTTSTSVTMWGAIRFTDGSTMGVTRPEDPVNGGFSIYHVGTAEVVGFIGADNVVNDIGGRNLGVCVGGTVTDSGLSGDCTIPAENPYLVALEAARAAQAAQAAQATQTTTSSPIVITDPNCPDTRNGDFDPSYSPAVCNANGYFWCSIAQACLDKPINVNECGEIWERS